MATLTQVKNKYNEANSFYEQKHQPITDAYNCCISNPCSIVNNNLMNVKTKINSELHKCSGWDDSANDCFIDGVNIILSNLEKISSSISSSWNNGEILYKDNYEKLNELKKLIVSLKNKISSYPNRDLYRHKEISLSGIIEISYPGYDDALSRWEQSCNSLISTTTNTINLINMNIEQLLSINGEAIIINKDLGKIFAPFYSGYLIDSYSQFSSDLKISKYFGSEYYVFGDLNYYRNLGYRGVQPSGQCLEYSRAWASNYLNGTTNHSSSILQPYGLSTQNKQTALKIIMSEISQGRPVVIRVNADQPFFRGTSKTSSRHFVTVCGVKKNADLNNLKESDFLIYDPTYNTRFKNLGSHAGGGSNDRKLLKKEEDSKWRGNKNYSNGYYLEIYNDSTNYLSIEDVNEGKV